MTSLLKKSVITAVAFLSLQAFAQATPSDSDIVTSIKNQVANNPATASTQVTITSEQGNVNLIGTVDTDQQAEAVVEMAQSTPGVADVLTSDFRVKESKQPFTDTVITAKVKGLFLRDKLFTQKDIAALSVKVETKNGVVHLSGQADSSAELQNAVQLARSVKGVKKVVSHVKVSNQ
jgi:hyperosmotically inducible protein